MIFWIGIFLGVVGTLFIQVLFWLWIEMGGRR